MRHEELRRFFPAMPAGDMVLFGGLAAASAPADDLTISEWSDRYRYVSEESGSPWPGRFKTDRVPYLREPQDCLHPDHPARRVTARWAAQLGKSTAIENWFGYIVDQAPGSMMIVLPTLEEATKFNRVKLQPTIDASPRIKHRVAAVSSRDEQGSTTAFKRFAGGFCQIVNAGSSKGLQMVSIKYLAMDETTGYLADVDGRGSPRDQARARQKMYGDLAKEWQGSTPGIAGECSITSDFEAGDRRHFYVPCPHCTVMQALTPEMMRGPDADRKLPAHIRCLSCDEPILDGHKGELLAGGEWIATRVEEGEEPVPAMIRPEDLERWRCPPCEGRCRDWQPSYHLWAAYAPRERFGAIWQRGQDAEGDATKMRVYCQQDLAEPYDPGGVAIDWQRLTEAAQASTYPQNIVPLGSALIVAAADVQGYGIKFVVYAIGPRGQRYLIDRQVFEGAPDQSDAPWIALADALGTQYETPSGKTKGIDLAGVDSGFATDRVYRFCSGRPNCYALDGRHKQGLPWLGTPVKRDIKDAHRRVVAKVMLYPVGLYDAKTEVVAGMANFVQGPDATNTWPRNTLHLTRDLCDDEFAQEMTAERLVDPDEPAGGNAKKKRLVLSRAGRVWSRLPGRKNDWFDATVYALALAWHLEHKRRLNADRWNELILALHGAEEDRDLFAAADSGPFASDTKPRRTDAERGARKQKWANRR